MKKIRNPGVDLFRIISMYGVVVSHTLGHGGAKRKYRYENLNFFEDFFIWHINGFCLISGIIGYKTHKYSNLLYLWLWVTFYSVCLYLYYKKYKPFSVSKFTLKTEFFPVAFSCYWYFTRYFGTYLFLPAINKGVEYLTKSELRIMILSLHSILVIWPEYNKIKTDLFNLNHGVSIVWFLVLYLTGAYIGKYNVIYHGIKKFIYCLICLTLFVSTSLGYYYLPNYNLYNINGYYLKKIIIFLNLFIEHKYASLQRIIQAISLSLFLIQLDYNKYIAKIISFFGPISFGIYLIHDNNLVRSNIIAHLFEKLPYNLPPNTILSICLIKTLKIFFICSMIDYTRHVIFTILRLRKICIFVEKIVVKNLS